MWVFGQFEKGSKAHTTFHVFLKSGVGLRLTKDTKVYFGDFSHFKNAFYIRGLKLFEFMRLLKEGLK